MGVTWDTTEAIETATLEGVVVGNVFPWGGNICAALQGEEYKTARSREQAKAYIEKHAAEHLRILALKDHQEDPEFVPDYRDLNRRDKMANDIKNMRF